MTAGQWVWLGGGYPPLVRDVTRNLARAARELAAAGVPVVAAFDRSPVLLASRRYEITAAYAARKLDARRPLDLTGWRHSWDATTELATLRIGGQLAAWLAARPSGDVYQVLAGQMNSRLRAYRPGYALEALAVARALAGAQPWPAQPDVIEGILKAVTLRQHGGEFAAHGWLNWGPGHPGALLTRTTRSPGGRP